MITWQGGDAAVVDDPRPPAASQARALRSPRTQAGFLQSLDALLVGRTAVALGAGRDKKGDAVDLSAGIMLHKKPGERVSAGEPMLELRYNDESRLAPRCALATQATVIGDQRAGRRAAGASAGCTTAANRCSSPTEVHGAE